MSAAVHCEACGRAFGGAVAYERHFLRRENRCRTPRQMRAAGLRYTGGAWRQASLPPDERAVHLPSITRRGGGSRTVEERTKAVPRGSGQDGPSVGERGLSQQSLPTWESP